MPAGRTPTRTSSSSRSRAARSRPSGLQRWPPPRRCIRHRPGPRASDFPPSRRRRSCRERGCRLAAEWGEQMADGQVGGVVGPGSSVPFDAVKPLLTRAEVPNCVTTVADGRVAGAPFTFRAAPSDRDRLASLIAYVRRSHADVRGVGVIDSAERPPRIGDDILAAQAGSNGLAYVGRASAGASDADAVSAMQLLAAQGAQAAFVDGPAELAARVAAGVAAAG